jgi:hypothetical protein
MEGRRNGKKKIIMCKKQNFHPDEAMHEKNKNKDDG